MWTTRIVEVSLVRPTLCRIRAPAAPTSIRSCSYRHSFKLPARSLHASSAQNFNLGSFFTPVTRKSPSSVLSSHAWHKVSAETPVSANLVPQGCELLVVLLGWLGAEQKHLRRYAEWYNSRGIHALTFALPMTDLLSLSVIDKADAHVESLYVEITRWLCEPSTKERSLIFHTFSNTGWFFYGALLEKFQERDEETFLKCIKGCTIDSAPAAELSPQVWASGFSTAFLKKQSFSTKSLAGLTEAERAVLVQPSMSETLLLASLERFFAMFLSVPIVKQRLQRFISILTSNQPPCPQLYLYSSADRVIPSTYVESFIALQKNAGYQVSSLNLQLSPHVDHLRNFPVLYCGQLETFLRECLHVKDTTTALKKDLVDC